MNKSVLSSLCIILMGWSLSAFGDHQNSTNKSSKTTATQPHNGAVEEAQRPEFPPTICQRYERRNYQAALDRVDSFDNAIVLVGESHGNRNSVEFIHEYILRRLADNKNILLSLEASLDGNFIFDQVWNNEITLEEGWSRLLQSWYWNENTDGRQSCAIALLMNDLIESGNSEKIEFLLTGITSEARKNSSLKGHAMASQLHQRMKKKNIDDDWAIIGLTGRNYQRVRSGYSVEEQSTMCGRLRQIVDREVLCIGTFGSKTPERELPCPEGEAFDILPQKSIMDAWGFYEGLDGVLVSPTRCADFTPRALETRVDFLTQKTR